LAMLASQPGPSGWPHRSNLIGSTQTSPSTYSITSNSCRASTISSLRGNYIRIVVQVTRDLQPVVYPSWLLPETDFNLGVSDVTLAQFEALANRLHRNLDVTPDITVNDWPALLSRSMVSLAKLLTILPASLGVSLELAYASSSVRERQSLGHQLDLNNFVDAVLRTIYHVSGTLDNLSARRRIVFTSFSQNICSALNWKQPNYPVFLVSRCYGKKYDLAVPSSVAFDIKPEDDQILSTVGATVEFARMNNLLGVFVDARLLMQVPSLIEGIRNAGLLVGIHGASEQSLALTTASTIEGTPVDAFFGDGPSLVVFMDHSMQELI